MEFGPNVGKALSGENDQTALLSNIKLASKAMPGVLPTDFQATINKLPVDQNTLTAFSSLTDEQVSYRYIFNFISPKGSKHKNKHKASYK